jgi:alkylation response protein AidB-like acyl-CoA dehydrogenase
MHFKGGIPMAPDQLLTNAIEFGRQAAPRAAEIEQARHLPRDLVEKMRALELFAMFVPKSHGGLEMSLPESLAVFEELAAADGVFGWLAMIGSHLPLVASALPRSGFDALYGDGPDLIGGGSVTPSGTAEIIDGGYRVNGRWPFASGCQHADYMFAFCLTTADGQPIKSTVQDAPPLRVVIVPAQQWQIEDTWHAAGLKGTGSHHVTLKNVVVPDTMSYDLLAARPSIDGPLYALGPIGILLYHLGAVAVGIAEGAIRDLVDMTNGGRRQLFARLAMRDSEVFQHELGLADADLHAARAYLNAEADNGWRNARAREPADPLRSARGPQAMAWIVATCAKVVDRCYTLGGGAALYESSPLQRRLRDAHATTQHVIAHYKSFAQAGRLRLGFPPVNPLTGR